MTSKGLIFIALCHLHRAVVAISNRTLQKEAPQ